MPTEELVVLCAEDGSAVGTAPKSTVHGPHTPLHLAFSSYVFDPEGRVLLTRRARRKRTFPGVRTNSCCGHPAPGESAREAVARRLRHELGIVATDVTLILPAFRYRAVDRGGTVENELCPVYRVLTQTAAVRPDPAEVDGAWWEPWTCFVAAAQADPQRDPLSMWCALQTRELAALGPDPLRWPEADPGLLPSALAALSVPGRRTG